jgi:calcium-dependent protein kinase
MLCRETLLLASLDHPNIVKLYDVYEDSRYIHLVMEWLTGGELFDRLVAVQQFSEQEASKIMKKIISAVQFMHSHNIAHRDLKPENFMFENESPEAEIKLIDFGLAKKFTHTATLNTFVGTPAYCAPEVLSAINTSTNYDS